MALGRSLHYLNTLYIMGYLAKILVFVNLTIIILTGTLGKELRANRSKPCLVSCHNLLILCGYGYQTQRKITLKREQNCPLLGIY